MPCSLLHKLLCQQLLKYQNHLVLQVSWDSQKFDCLKITSQLDLLRLIQLQYFHRLFNLASNIFCKGFVPVYQSFQYRVCLDFSNMRVFYSSDALDQILVRIVCS
eukprot:NODE_508_length_7458_cov_0.132491.p12 type:complete len:105 gc:universal NODE_508_length_7458_cov_0.132491:2467-2153(-)